MIGTAELVVILCVILLLFGGKKLPEFARNLGVGIREFKKACSGAHEEESGLEPKLQKIEVEVPVSKDRDVGK
jgi:sec-independent protein translocase protein TatA